MSPFTPVSIEEIRSVFEELGIPQWKLYVEELYVEDMASSTLKSKCYLRFKFQASGKPFSFPFSILLSDKSASDCEGIWGRGSLFHNYLSCQPLRLPPRIHNFPTLDALEVRLPPNTTFVQHFTSYVLTHSF